MSLFRYVVQGFGWAMGREAAKQAMAKAAELGESELADAERALDEEEARRRNATGEAERQRDQRRRERADREARAAEELERLKRERGKG